MDNFNMTCQAFLYRLYSSIVYRRIDGLIISSTPTTVPQPTPFSISDLFAIYTTAFGAADLTSTPQSRTPEILASIQYHAVQQLISFLSQVQVSQSGTRDFYWGSAAVRGLILPMYMDFINPVPVEFITSGSSAFKSFPLIIPIPAVIFYGACVFIVLIWSLGRIIWLYRHRRAESGAVHDLEEAMLYVFPGANSDAQRERGLVLMGDCWWPLWGGSSKEIAGNAKGMAVHVTTPRNGQYALCAKSCAKEPVDLD